MIAGAGVLPTTPLLVPGVSAASPPGLERIAAAAAAVVAGLPAHEVAVLLTAARAGEPPGIHPGGRATLAGIGRPDLAVAAPADPALAARLSEALDLPLHPEGPLPLAAAVLTHLLHPAPAVVREGSRGRAAAMPSPTATAAPTSPAAPRSPATPPGAVPAGAVPLAAVAAVAAPLGVLPARRARAVVAVVVPPAADPVRLVALGETLAVELEGVRAVVVAAGDLAAGLTDKAPLALVEGAGDWNDRAADAVASGRLDGLPGLGPRDAARVGALGWAPLVVLHGATARARLGLVLRAAGSPRGVGYLVAAGA